MTTNSSKSPSPKTSSTNDAGAQAFRPHQPRNALTALAYGAAVGGPLALVIALLAWLSPLAAADRPVLALLALTISLPLGAAVMSLSRLRQAGRPPHGQARRPPHASDSGLRALAAAAVLTLVLCGAEPALWARALSWCMAAALIGASATALWRPLGFAAALAWLGLNGLPFFYHRLPLALEGTALRATPWLGFSQDAFGGDPLRHPVIYMGQWSELTSLPAAGLLSAPALWVGALAALVAALAAGAWRGRVSMDAA
jgi:hypothetical protein